VKAPYLHRGKPVRRTERIVDTDFSIVAQFQSEYRGVAEYYRLAFNRHKLGRLKYVMERSLTKTLARKYLISVPQVYRRYRAVLGTEYGPRRGLRVTVDRDGKPPLVAQWGGISLARDTTPRPLNDDPARIWSHRSEIVRRLMADECELCGSRKQVEVHHIRALKDLNRKGKGNPPEWARRMAARRRKTLVVCRACHEGIHSGSPHGNHDEHGRAEMLGKRASPVRREAVRKGPLWHLAGGPPYWHVRFGGGQYGKGPTNCGNLAVRPTQLSLGSCSGCWLACEPLLAGGLGDDGDFLEARGHGRPRRAGGSTRRPVRVPADEAEHLGLRVGVVLHRHPGTVLSGRPHDLLDRLHSG
jgi:hypothetical protein